MPVDDGTGRANRVLAALTRDLRAEILERAWTRDFEVRDVVYEQGEQIGHIVFPLRGVFSLLSAMEDGRAVEVATVGNEGFIGLPVFLRAAQTSAHRAIAQVAGSAVCLDASAFQEVLGRNGGLQTALLRYAQALITQIAQGSACNRLHPVAQRCARWLLLTHDRVGRPEFALTEEFLGRMLGVQPPAVGAAAQPLHDAGLIRYVRGRITVLDRPGLEAASCECYGVIRGELERLVG